MKERLPLWTFSYERRQLLKDVKLSSRAEKAMAIVTRMRSISAEYRQLAAELDLLLGRPERKKPAAAAKKKPARKTRTWSPEQAKKMQAADKKVRVKFIRVLGRFPGGLTANAISEETEIGYSKTQRILKDMAKEKLVRKVRVDVDGRPFQGYVPAIKNGK